MFQGNLSSRYAVVPRVLVFLFAEDHVLLLKGGAEKPWAGKYNGLGGHVEPGEDPLRAARREVAEESGLSCSHLSLRGVVTVETGQPTGVLLFIFQGTLDQRKPPTASAEGVLEWVPLSKVPQLPLLPDLYTLLPRLIHAETNPSVFFATLRYDAKGCLHLRFSE